MTRMNTPQTDRGRVNTAGRLRRYLSNALASNTVNAYASDLRHFTAWGGRIPATPEMVARYLVDCAGRFKAATLARRLAAIQYAHGLIAKVSPTTSALVKRTLRGILRVHGAAVNQAAPVSMGMLRALARPRADLSEMRDLRDRTLLVLGFAGGFRRSELVALRPGDLQVTREEVLITVRRSKTDAQGRGRVVAVPMGRGRMCPVALLNRWTQALRRHEPEASEQPLFRRIDRHGNLGAGLRAASVRAILKERIAACGYDAKPFSAHSLRAGLVSAAASAGASTWAIQRQTGHRSERSVNRYIRGVRPFEENAFRIASH